MRDTRPSGLSPETQLQFARIAAKAALLQGRKPDPRAVKVLREHSDPLADAEPA
ncbi:hypothetical protein ACXYTP_10745 [Tsukamurella ocularis]|uniref:hypothetical protein n=1 Tax=Tsukamurella ocularis TaxID=1970234 RepID=UPI0039F09126